LHTCLEVGPPAGEAGVLYLNLFILLGVSWERLGGHHTAGQDIEPDPQDPCREKMLHLRLSGLANCPNLTIAFFSGFTQSQILTCNIWLSIFDKMADFASVAGPGFFYPGS
jgi:hypothetical protein